MHQIQDSVPFYSY